MFASSRRLTQRSSRCFCIALAAALLLAVNGQARAQRLLRPPASRGEKTPATSAAKDGQPAKPAKAAAATESKTQPSAQTARHDATKVKLASNSEAAASGISPVALQAALDRAGFSPGIIDGAVGRKTRMALRAFQGYAGLPATGTADAATRRALATDTEPTLRQYTLTTADAAQVAPPPKGWIEKSQVRLLGYESLAALAAEKGHCTVGLLAMLNPKVNLKRLKPGDSLWLPNAAFKAEPRQAANLEVDFGDKVVRTLDKSGRTIALLHCSIAADRANLPSSRSCYVATVAKNPTYTFDPAMWPEVKGVDRKLTIPPGPRNPVGLCWIGLSLDGYGIHGTPNPEMIGRTGSHGCIRLANWDAQRLAKMVQVGTPVSFTR